MTPGKGIGIRKQVDGYAKQLQSFVTACARQRFDANQEAAFLWNARRSLEAMLRSLLAPYPPRRFEELEVEALLKDAIQRTIIPYEIAPSFESLEELTRRGARVLEPTARDLSQAVSEGAQALERATSWFFRTSSPDKQVPADVARALDIITSTKQHPTRREVAAKRQRELIEELHTAVSDRDAFFSSLLNQVADLTEQIETERTAARENRESLERLKTDILETVSTLDDAASLSSPTATSGRTYLPPLIAGAICLILGLLAGGYLAGEAALPEGEPSRVQATGDIDAADAAGDGSAGDDTELTDEEAASEAGDPLDVGQDDVTDPVSGSGGDVSCPSGMIGFDGAEVRVIQPFPRRSWPSGPKVLPPVEVGPFCMDREPVLVSEYQKCVAVGACPARNGCQGHPENYPVNCVTWSDAAAYCRWRDAGLPRIVHWERTLLSSKVRPEPASGTWEWTGDPFPAPVLERGPVKREEDGTVWGYMALQKLFRPRSTNRWMCSWHKAPALASRGNLSFRCMIELDGS